jgi:hypothetical protein
MLGAVCEFSATECYAAINGSAAAVLRILISMTPMTVSVSTAATSYDGRQKSDGAVVEILCLAYEVASLEMRRRAGSACPSGTHCVSHALKSTLLDLPYPLARHAMLPRQFVQGLRFVREHPRLQNCAFARR